MWLHIGRIFVKNCIFDLILTFSLTAVADNFFQKYDFDENYYQCVEYIRSEARKSLTKKLELRYG